jgi:pheromone a factor receptor
MPAPPNYVFTVFTFVAFFLCLIKFPTQFHGTSQEESPCSYLNYYYSAWNVGTHLFLAWVGLLCLFLGINSIIWNHNTVNWAPVWCDISQSSFFFALSNDFTGVYHVTATRFGVGVSIAVPATVLCINRRLYLLASPTTIIPSKADKNREVIIDLAIGIGLPIIVVVLCLSSNLSLYFFGLSIFSVSCSKLSIYNS